MNTIEVGPGETAENIVQRYPNVFEWREGTLVKRAGIGDVRVVRTAEDGDVYEAPLRNPVVDEPIPCPKPIKVKPRSKRGQRKRMWR